MLCFAMLSYIAEWENTSKKWMRARFTYQKQQDIMINSIA